MQDLGPCPERSCPSLEALSLSGDTEDLSFRISPPPFHYIYGSRAPKNFSDTSLPTHTHPSQTYMPSHRLACRALPDWPQIPPAHF